MVGFGIDPNIAISHWLVPSLIQQAVMIINEQDLSKLFRKFCHKMIWRWWVYYFSSGTARTTEMESWAGQSVPMHRQASEPRRTRNYEGLSSSSHSVSQSALLRKQTVNSLSELFIPLSATFIWTCRFNLLHTAIQWRIQGGGGGGDRPLPYWLIFLFQKVVFFV